MFTHKVDLNKSINVILFSLGPHLFQSCPGCFTVVALAPSYASKQHMEREECDVSSSVACFAICRLCRNIDPAAAAAVEGSAAEQN